MRTRLCVFGRTASSAWSGVDRIEGRSRLGGLEGSLGVFERSASLVLTSMLSSAAKNFDALIRLPLRPCAYAQWEDNRKRIDAVVAEMLGFGDDLDEDVEQLRRRWCREPGVHSGKIEIVALLKADGMLA